MRTANYTECDGSQGRLRKGDDRNSSYFHFLSGIAKVCSWRVITFIFQLKHNTEIGTDCSLTDSQED